MTEEEKMPQQGNKAAATDQAAISQPDKQEKQEGETALQQAEGNGEQTPAWFYKGFKALPYVILVFAILLVAINRFANKIGPQNRLNFGLLRYHCVHPSSRPCQCFYRYGMRARKSLWQ